MLRSMTLKTPTADREPKNSNATITATPSTWSAPRNTTTPSSPKRMTTGIINAMAMLARASVSSSVLKSTSSAARCTDQGSAAAITTTMR